MTLNDPEKHSFLKSKTHDRAGLQVSPILTIIKLMSSKPVFPYRLVIKPIKLQIISNYNTLMNHSDIYVYV